MVNSVIVFNSSFVGSSAAQGISWNGGRSALVLNASAYGGGVFLQLQGPSGAWISLNGSTYSADQVTTYDLPRGQYRMISNTSSSIGVYAILTNVTYS